MSGLVRASGAIVWRVREGNLHVLLIHRAGYNDWSWPKGKLNPEESHPAAAVREVAEETGIDVVLDQPLPTVHYRVGGGREKDVTYWAAHAVDGSPALAARAAVRRASTREVDEVRWMDVHQALRILTYPRDRRPLEHLMDLWDEDRLATSPLLVVRHARARKRSAWKSGQEPTRPLTDIGEQQAGLLVPLLSAYGVERVITSPWERCAATVTPYAEAAGIKVSLEEKLTEDAHQKKPKPVVDLVKKEVSRLAGGAVICTHRPVLPTVMEQLEEYAPNRLRPRVPEEDPYLRTGELLVVHLAPHKRRSAGIVAVERHRPFSA